MDWNPDFRDLFFELNVARAEYLVIGGYAVVYWAEPRFTKDIDVLVRPTPENAVRVRSALERFGAPVDRVSLADLVNPRTVLQMGLPPNRIDILTEAAGVDFAGAWDRRVVSTYADQAVPVIGLDDLIAAKRAAGRPQDQVDLQGLLAVRARRSPPR